VITTEWKKITIFKDNIKALPLKKICYNTGVGLLYLNQFKRNFRKKPALKSTWWKPEQGNF
jgi:hypothetical protein